MNCKAIILLLLTSAILLSINSILHAQDVLKKKQIEDSGKYKNIEINILSANISKEKQTFTKGAIFKDGKITWTTYTEEPKKGEAYGIIQYKLTIKEKGTVSIDYKDMYLIINNVRVEFIGEIHIDSEVVFGSGFGYTIEGEAIKTENIIFTLSEKDFKNATLQLGNHKPIKIDFEIKKMGGEN